MPIPSPDASVESANVAIIQGSLDTTFPPDPTETERVFNQYARMSEEITARGRSEGNNIDLVVWPESMFRFDVFSYDESLARRATDADGLHLPRVVRTERGIDDQNRFAVSTLTA